MNKKIIHSFLAATILFFSCEKHGKLEWENPTIFEINKLPPKAHFISYETEKLAQINNPLESKNYISLNGNWNFKFSDNSSAVSVSSDESGGNNSLDLRNISQAAIIR